MANLTKEYFDRKIGGVAKDLKSYVNDKNSELAKDLKSYVNDKHEELARLVSAGFEDVIKRLDVRERVEKLEKKVGRIMEAINLRV